MYNSIVAAVDGSERGFHAFAHALSQAEKSGVRLTVVHVLLRGVGHDGLFPIIDQLKLDDAKRKDLEQILTPPLTATGAGGVEAPIAIVPDEALRMVGERIIERCQTLAKGKGITFESKIVDGDPAKTVVELAREKNADLIVVGSRGLGRVKGLLLGSVSQKIVQAASCACLVVK